MPDLTRRDPCFSYRPTPTEKQLATLRAVRSGLTRLADIARALAIHTQVAHDRLERLQDRGWLDRRAEWFVLSERGAKVLGGAERAPSSA